MFNKTMGVTLALTLAAALPSFAAGQSTVAPLRQQAAMDFLNPLPTALTPRDQAVKTNSEPLFFAAEGDELSFDFGYCYEPESAFGMTAGEKQKFAIYVPEETCKRFAGAKVEAAVIANGCIPNDEYSNFKIAFYRSLDDAEPFYSFDSKMEVRNHFAWRAHELPEPFVIEADKPFYYVMEWDVKYYGQRDEEDYENNFYPCSIDWAIVPDDRGYSDLCYSIDIYTLDYIWSNLGALLGNNCMRLRLSGDDLLSNDIGVSSLMVPSRIAPDEEFTGTVVLTNWGANRVTECVYTIQIGNGKPMEFTADFDGESLRYHDSYQVAFAVATEEIGPNLPVKIDIVSVNSQPDSDPTNNVAQTATLSITDEDGYERNLYVEESTGVWCGWCPMGIESFDQMRHLIPDQFVGMAIHTQSDPMIPWDGSFDEIVKSFGGQAPMMYVNNNRSQVVNPSPQIMALAYNIYCIDPAYVHIDINNVTAKSTGVEFSVDYEFAGDADNVYSLIYAVTEDNVGPYPQQNYFPTGYQGEMFGWENKNQVEIVTFQDVAVTRKVFDKATIFPDKISGKVKYSDKCTLPIDNTNRPEQRKEVKPEDVNVIVAVINNLNGLVENCAIHRADSFTSINEVDAAVTPSENAAPEYFDLNGRRVNPDGLKPGIYLLRQGSNASKILIH